jgi:tRNA threonylcarbamoyladenosine biosynthesis protein TsaB
MSYLLAIETTTEICSVALGNNKQCIALIESDKENSHAEKIMLFVDEVLQQTGLKPSALEAVIISEGPGSYTGLRIGVSSAKGLCYALNIPLIAVSTLQSMAWGAKEKYPQHNQYCPMIDARRMEVYSAVYDSGLKTIQVPTNVIVDENAYLEYLEQGIVVFSGNAVEKTIPVLSQHSNAVFSPTKTSARYLVELGYKKYFQKEFADTAYFEPFYLKEFQSAKPRVKGL